MRLEKVLLAAALLPGLGLSSAAAGEEKKCEYPLQECLDMMVRDIKDRGWLGIEYDVDAETGKSVVLKVVPDSPAEAAGFREGDVLVAIEDVDLGDRSGADRSRLASILVPGRRVTYTVLRGEKTRKLRATLAPITREIMAQWVGRHMLEHYQEPPGGTTSGDR